MLNVFKSVNRNKTYRYETNVEITEKKTMITTKTPLKKKRMIWKLI